MTKAVKESCSLFVEWSFTLRACREEPRDLALPGSCHLGWGSKGLVKDGWKVERPRWWSLPMTFWRCDCCVSKIPGWGGAGYWILLFLSSLGQTLAGCHLQKWHPMGQAISSLGPVGFTAMLASTPSAERTCHHRRGRGEGRRGNRPVP